MQQPMYGMPGVQMHPYSAGGGQPGKGSMPMVGGGMIPGQGMPYQGFPPRSMPQMGNMVQSNPYAAQPTHGMAMGMAMNGMNGMHGMNGVNGMNNMNGIPARPGVPYSAQPSHHQQQSTRSNFAPKSTGPSGMVFAGNQVPGGSGGQQQQRQQQSQSSSQRAGAYGYGGSGYQR